MLAQTPASLGLSSPIDAFAAAGNLTPAAKKLPPRRVLVVDDEALVRWAIEQTLDPRLYSIEEAADAESALLALLRGRSPDVVLLDLRLPDCNDLQLLKAIRRMAPAAAVVLMTAFGTPDIRAEALTLGAAGVLDKPFDVERLDALLWDLPAAS